VLHARHIRLPHGTACAVAAVRAAMLHLQVLQIGQIGDQAKGKNHRPPDQDGSNRIEYPIHKVHLVLRFG
jgi:hypothetical protein